MEERAFFAHADTETGFGRSHQTLPPVILLHLSCSHRGMELGFFLVVFKLLFSMLYNTKTRM